MDLAEALKRKQGELKRTETVETNKDGQKFRVRRNDQGEEISRELIKGVIAPLIESAPDPAVVHILDGLFLGSQDAAVNVVELDAKGVTHILNVATGIPNGFPEKYVYKNVEILDVDESDVRKEFDKCFEFIEEARKAGGVLVHCNAGVSRSATVVIAYLMQNQRKSFKDAHVYVKERRSAIKPNPGFVAQLEAYSKELGL